MTQGKAFLVLLAAFVWLLGGLVVLANIPVPEEGADPRVFVLWLGPFFLLFLTGTAVWAGAKGYSALSSGCW